MVWFWIILGLGVIVGSISWLLPSPAERVQANRRSEALALGLKVQHFALDGWARERLERAHVIQYKLFCDHQIRSFRLWHVPGRTEPWASPPESKSWDLIEGALSDVLQKLPADVQGLGAQNGCVWLAIDDASSALNAPDIQGLLREIVTALSSQTRQQS
jgi:hypothetical protein